jgi:hypothetical protein
MNMDMNNNEGTQEQLSQEASIAAAAATDPNGQTNHTEPADTKEQISSAASDIAGDDGYVVVEDGGQLSLFGFDSVIAPGSSDKKENKADSCAPEVKPTSGGKADAKSGKGRGKGKVATPVIPPVPELESVKLGEGWKIHYAAQVFEVDVLFADDIAASKESIPFEDIRLKLVMEEDAAELTPSGTKWRYDEDQKQLFPDAWGQDKGAR